MFFTYKLTICMENNVEISALTLIFDSTNTDGHENYAFRDIFVHSEEWHIYMCRLFALNKDFCIKKYWLASINKNVRLSLTSLLMLNHWGIGIHIYVKIFCYVFLSAQNSFGRCSLKHKQSLALKGKLVQEWDGQFPFTRASLVFCGFCTIYGITYLKVWFGEIAQK